MPSDSDCKTGSTPRGPGIVPGVLVWTYGRNTGLGGPASRGDPAGRIACAQTCEDRRVDEAGDLGVLEASRLLARRSLSAAELTEACLARIRERDGVHSHEGDPGSVNAWVRVYEEDARAAAAAADERLAAGDAPPLCGIPIGLKDLYAVAGSRSPPRAGFSTSSPTGTATPGRASRRRGWSSSATSTRTSSPAAGRPTRSATRGRSNARPVARAAAPARRSRRARYRRRPARTRQARSASRPRNAARRPSSPPAVSSRSGARAARAELRPRGADGPHGG